MSVSTHSTAIPLCDIVQKNCHITDAHHASDFTLCVYLLKMREYYRWEMGYTFDHAMSKEEVGNWLVQREQLWEELEDESYQPLVIDDQPHDPFETEEINRSLLPKGFVYSAGLGRGSTPHFFLGKLDKHVEHQDYTILVSDAECARDLSAPPAMALGRSIYIRRESLRRMIWEKVMEWRWHQYENAMGRALSDYDFEHHLDTALDQMTENELTAVTYHEIGEIMAGEHLGGEWETMLASMTRSRAEIMARAVRDHLADSLSTLPKLIEDDNHASLHFYMGNLTAMRKDLFPGFAQAYQHWHESGDIAVLQHFVALSANHWIEVGEHMLDLYSQYGDDCAPQLEQLIETSRL